MSKIIVTKEDNKIYSALLNEQDRLLELQVENLEKQRIIGNIYIGQVIKVENSIEVAFVDIGLDETVFLPFGGRAKLFDTNATVIKQVKQGDEVLVQLVKEGTDTKGPKGTSGINIWNVLPFSTSDVISIEPPISETSLLVIGRPSPVPPYFL